jgi:hypothetical protein
MKLIFQLAFNGQCREAFEQYERILGGKITVMNAFGEANDADFPPGCTPPPPAKSGSLNSKSVNMPSWATTCRPSPMSRCAGSVSLCTCRASLKPVASSARWQRRSNHRPGGGGRLVTLLWDGNRPVRRSLAGPCPRPIKSSVQRLQPTPWNAFAFQALVAGAADLVSLGRSQYRPSSVYAACSRWETKR